MKLLVVLSKNINNILSESKKLADNTTFKEVMAKLKGDSLLKSLCEAVDSLKVKNVRPELAEKYVNNAIKATASVDFSRFNNAAKKLCKTTKISKLDYAIGVVLFEKVTPNNIREYTDSFNLVTEWVCSDYTNMKKIDNLNKKLNPIIETLDENDLSLYKKFMQTDEIGKIELYESLKSETLNLLSNSIKSNSANDKALLALYEVKDRILQEMSNYSIENLTTLHNTKKLIGEKHG